MRMLLLLLLHRLLLLMRMLRLLLLGLLVLLLLGQLALLRTGRVWLRPRQRAAPLTVHALVAAVRGQVGLLELHLADAPQEDLKSAHARRDKSTAAG